MLIFFNAHIHSIFLCFLIHPNAITHTATDKSDPPGAASPMGYKFSGNHREAKNAPGTRTHTIDSTLCKKEIPDSP